MCKGRARMAGIIASGALAKRHMPGYSGIVKVEYVGQVERAQLPASLFSKIAYEYGTERPEFYVDARDLGRVLAWTENGYPAFLLAPTNKG